MRIITLVGSQHTIGICLTKSLYMKKAILALLFTLMPLLAFAPANGEMAIATAPIIKIKEAPVIFRSNYDNLIIAIARYESNGIDSIINQKEQAYGRLQIRQCRVDAYNRVTGKSYKLEDMFNFNIAREVFLYYAKGKTYEQAAKDWNGSGPLTITYWAKVKAIGTELNLFSD